MEPEKAHNSIYIKLIEVIDLDPSIAFSFWVKIIGPIAHTEYVIVSNLALLGNFIGEAEAMKTRETTKLKKEKREEDHVVLPLFPYRVDNKSISSITFLDYSEGLFRLSQVDTHHSTTITKEYSLKLLTSLKEFHTSLQGIKDTPKGKKEAYILDHLIDTEF